jgi:hypothetical protein
LNLRLLFHILICLILITGNHLVLLLLLIVIKLIRVRVIIISIILGAAVSWTAFLAVGNDVGQVSEARVDLSHRGAFDWRHP